MSSRKEEIAGAVAILDRFTRENPVHERNAAKRVFAEVVQAWPGEVRRLWWKWFTEASLSLGLRTKTFSCSLDEACNLARDQAQIICYRQDESLSSGGQWLAVLAGGRRRYEVLLADEHENDKAMSARALRKALSKFAVDGQLRCVAMQPADVSTGQNEQPKKLSPARRLGQILKPELSDIWIIIIFAFVVSSLMLATPMAVEALVNTVAFGRFVQPIVILAVILLTFLGFQGAIRALQTYVAEIVQRRLFARVAGDLAYRIPRTDVESVDGQHVPELTNRFFDVVTVQKIVALLLLDGLGLVLSTLIGMAVLGFYHPWLLGFDLFLLGAISLIIFVVGRGAVASAIKESKHKYYMASWLEDIASCPVAFRNDGGVEFALERADRLIHEYLIARKKHFRIVMRQVLFALGLQAIASTVLLGLGGWLVVSGELTLGQLVAAELIVTAIVGSFAKFGKHMESFYDLLASVDKLGVLFDLHTERQDGMLAIDRSAPPSVELNAVSYAWPGQAPVLNSVQAAVAGGERVAIVGGSGSGKSTLLDLIHGLRAPVSGHVTIDGFDPRDLRPDVLRDRVALARSGEVFHATIAENVHMHREGITTTEVRDVLDALGLLDPILCLKDGYDTMLVSDGTPLSKSQHHVLAIARAAIGRPGLLLIDGALDILGEEDLEHCLRFLLDAEHSWTLVVATSRREIAEQFTKRIELTRQAVTR